ncbi:cell wall hydrolase, partial [Acidisphaera sp. S103]|uniref:cell wall hydrolase n=1 Tax=Acidisphaera sp. S103 TaxID=1747223 RepID=UPI001574F836
ADGVHTEPALDEKQYLAMTLYGEARGEAHASRVAVAWVIRNRVQIGRWGNSYRSVVTARLQFTCWSLKADPKNYSAIHNPSGAAWTDCQEIARQVIAASPASNPVPGATNYYSPKTQSALHRQNPDLYDETPDWTDPPAVVVPNPSGVPETSFRFYKNV